MLMRENFFRCINSEHLAFVNRCMPHIFCLAQFANRTHGPPIVVARQARGEAFLLTGIQGSPTFSAHFGPIAGRERQLGGAACPARSSRRKPTLLAVPSLLDVWYLCGVRDENMISRKKSSAIPLASLHQKAP